MMVPFDVNQFYRQWAMSHPIYGPLYLNWYTSSLAYSWYLEWVRLILSLPQPPTQSGKSS